MRKKRKPQKIPPEYLRNIVSLFFDEKPINGSLNKILQINSEADKNHVSKAMRDKIAEALRKAFLLANPGYKDPNGQLELNFE